MSLIGFNQVVLKIGGNAVLDKVDWQLEPNRKIALVGRNGAGKSTLLQLLEGKLQVDSGQINRSSGLKIAGLVQDVPVDEQELVYHFLVKPLGNLGEVLTEFYCLSRNGTDEKQLASCHQQMDAMHAWEWLWQVETMATRLDIDPSLPMQALSGGMKRRVLLAASLIAKPDLLLLDEPTNHLDLSAIEWLENYLKNFNGTLVVVTHDRAFLKQVADTILEIDRGKLYSFHCDYESYLDRREAMRQTEQKHDALFDKRLSEEEAWLRQGVKARRTRNEGRVRALKAMRDEASRKRAEQGMVKGFNLGGSRSGNLVIEAKNVNYSINGRQLIKDFSLLLTRGDKLGIIGPNGCGKTTLVKLLLGEIAPDSGSIKQGVSLKVAYFDQLRSQLDENESVMNNVADGMDYVTIQGKQKHVATWLKEFLFLPERFNQPVFSLSGGEKNRLILAKLLAKPVNFLVMDEPTNDLDIETLELLEKLLLDFQGTLIIISHDRDFINQVVSSILIWEEGKFIEHVGGYDEYRAQKKLIKDTSSQVKAVKRTAPSNKITFNEQFELTELPKKIEALESRIAICHQKMLEEDFYKQPSEKITEINQKLESDEKALEQLYQRWEDLEAKK